MAGTIPGTPPVPVSDLRTEAVAGSASTDGGWSGATYSGAGGASDDEIVFYTDIEAPGTQPFGGEMGKYGTDDGLEADGNLPIVAATDAMLIASSDFPTGPGIRTHMAGSDGTVEVAGTFDGAEGSYVCTPAMDNGCTSSIRAVGGIALAGGGGWTFVPAEDATVAKTDTEYRYFGWWLRDLGDELRRRRLPRRRGRRCGGLRGSRDVAGDGDLYRPGRRQVRHRPPARRRAGRELHRQGDA